MAGPARGFPRWIEVPLCLLGLAFLAPLLAVSAVGVCLTSRGPVLFRQERVGRGGRHFTLLKFRTMTVNQGGPQVTRRDDARVTPVGRVLRTLKLDEVPELWNVVRGDISLVGPRPEVPRYVNLEDPLWREALKVRPGITDPVTLRLRNEEDLLPPDEDPERFYREVLQPVKLRGYVEYLRRRTWATDLITLFETLLAVVVPSAAPPPSLKDLERPAEELFHLSRWPVRR